jgi:uncharacterized repeat protein (TIGR01451 family)
VPPLDKTVPPVSRSISPAPAALPAFDPPPAAVVPASARGEMPGGASPADPKMVQERRAPESLPETVMGKQEPALSLEWQGPPTARLGVPSDYTLAVRNTSSIPVQQVLVRVRLPGSLRAASTEPRAVADGSVLVWELGTLQSRQGRSLQLRLVAEARGDVMPQAWVTFTGSALTCIRVRQPQLALKVAAPDRKLVVGDPAAFTLTVGNPGDGAAEQVRVHVTLGEGLEHPHGKTVHFDVGNLAPGESRNVTLLCAARSGGPQRCEAAAEADGGLGARDTASVDITAPRIELHTAGPALRYLGRKATYTFKVNNPGDTPAANVTITDAVPAGLRVLSATHGGRHDPAGRTVTWFVGEVPPGQSREVQLEVQAADAGDHRQQAAATGARGLNARAEVVTHVEGLSALLVELVDTEDPIEVGSDTCYEVRVTNTGSKPETDIRLAATVPEQMEFQSAQGGRCRADGKSLIFEPVSSLGPREEALFKIHVRALRAGTVRFKIQVTSASVTEPVVKMEATRIYADTPDPKGGGN